MAKPANLISVNELAQYLGVPIDTIYKWNHSGTGPRFAKVGRHVRYRMSDVECWLNDRSGVPVAGRGMAGRAQ